MSRYDLPDSEVLAARNGDKGAQARVFASVEGLAKWIVRRRARHLPSTMDFDEAVQHCRLAVFDAIRKYQPGKSKFGSYAALWMRARLNQAIDIERAGSSPRVRDQRSGRQRFFRTVPIDRRTHEDRAAPIEYLADDVPLLDDSGEDVQAQLRAAIAALDDKHRSVIEERLAGGTNEDIASRLGRSRERTRQMITDAVVDLRRVMGAPMDRPVFFDRAKRGAHGTNSLYVSGCRCRACKQAHLEKTAADRLRLKQRREAA